MHVPPELVSRQAAASRLETALTEQSTGYDAIVQVACFATGFSALLSQIVDLTFGGIYAPLLLTAVVALLGWWRGVNAKPIKIFFAFAIFLTVAATISSAVAGTSLVTPLGMSFWLFFIVPGVAAVCSERPLRRALLTGLVAGALLFLAVAAMRLAFGQSIIDPIGGGNARKLLGLNRRVVDEAVITILPLIALRQVVRFRTPFVGMYLAGAVVWVVSSQSRSGLLALLLAPLFVLTFSLKPSPNGVPRRILLLTATAALVYIGTANVHIPGLPATERLAAARQGYRDHSDEVRVMLLKKAYRIGLENPLTGVGWGNLTKAYHPVIDAAKTPRIRQASLETHTHNAYFEVFGALGIPGLIGWVGAMFVPIFFAARRSTSPEVRAAAAALMLSLFFEAAGGGFGAPLYLTVALALAVVSDPTSNDDEPTPGSRDGLSYAVRG